MLSSTEKIKKFISLEIERGYDNRSVVGGMEKFLPIWRREAPTEGVSEEIIKKSVNFCPNTVISIKNAGSNRFEIC